MLVGLVLLAGLGALAVLACLGASTGDGSDQDAALSTMRLAPDRPAAGPVAPDDTRAPRTARCVWHPEKARCDEWGPQCNGYCWRLWPTS